MAPLTARTTRTPRSVGGSRTEPVSFDASASTRAPEPRSCSSSSSTRACVTGASPASFWSQARRSPALVGSASLSSAARPNSAESPSSRSVARVPMTIRASDASMRSVAAEITFRSAIAQSLRVSGALELLDRSRWHWSLCSVGVPVLSASRQSSRSRHSVRPVPAATTVAPVAQVALAARVGPPRAARRRRRRRHRARRRPPAPGPPAVAEQWNDETRPPGPGGEDRGAPTCGFSLAAKAPRNGRGGDRHVHAKRSAQSASGAVGIPTITTTSPASAQANAARAIEKGRVSLLRTRA